MGLAIVTNKDAYEAMRAENQAVIDEYGSEMMPASVRPWSDFMGSLIGFLALLPIAYGGWLGFSTSWGDGNYYYGEFDFPE